MTTESNVSKEIFQKLQHYASTENIGLLDGLAGECLYYFYRSEVLHEEASYETAVIKLQETLEKFSQTEVQATFYNGISGIGWMLCHLNEAELVSFSVEDVIDTAVDTLLYEQMLMLLNRKLFDFFHGASGICFYFLKRYTTTQDATLKATYKTYITHFLFRLEYLSLAHKQGMYWLQASYTVQDDGVQYRLSGDHQNVSILLLLTEIVKAADFNTVCVSLVERSSNWLLHEVTSKKDTRIDQAFCLWKASRVLKDAVLEETSLQLLKEASILLSQENYNSQHTYALIYQKIAKETDDLFFYTKAQECFQVVTNHITDKYIQDCSVWKGYAGIGLTDFSIHHHLRLDWAHCMLI